MIVVVGLPAWNPEQPPSPAGRAAAIAIAAASAGATVELLGRVGSDPAGDALVLALGRAGVGHVAVLRDPARPTLLHSPQVTDEDELLGTVSRNGLASPGLPDDEGPRLQPADVSLGLRYLSAFGVLVVGEDAPANVIPSCADAAAFAGARLVVVVRSAGVVPVGLPEDATVLVAPDGEGEAFSQLLGRYAAALDRGSTPEAAFAAAAGGGWERPGG
jgi:sugar/nucleoside kinase (ribokinase family)